jgi:hypothetical protein
MVQEIPLLGVKRLCPENMPESAIDPDSEIWAFKPIFRVAENNSFSFAKRTVAKKLKPEIADEILVCDCCRLAVKSEKFQVGERCGKTRSLAQERNLAGVRIVFLDASQNDS